MSLPTWYLMFDGSSPDGRGNAEFIGRTEDAEISWKHYAKCCDDPYSTGYVLRVTDSVCERFDRAAPHYFGQR
jgi:hypothetical protein